MKKISAVILALVLVLSVAVCPSFAADNAAQKKISLPNDVSFYHNSVVSDSGMVAAIADYDNLGHMTDTIVYSKDNIKYSTFSLSKYAVTADYSAYLVCRGDEFLIAVYSEKPISKNGNSSGTDVSVKLLSTKDFKTVKSVDCPKKVTASDVPTLGEGLTVMNNGDVILALPGYVKTKTEKYDEYTDNIYGYGIYYVIDKNGKWTERHSPEALMSGAADGVISDFFVRYEAKGDMLETDIEVLFMGGGVDHRPYEGYFTFDYNKYVKYTDDKADGIDLLAADKDSASAYVYSRLYASDAEGGTVTHILSAVNKNTGKSKKLISYTYDGNEFFAGWKCLTDCDGYNYCFMYNEKFESIVNRIDMKTGEVKTFKTDVNCKEIEDGEYSNGYIVLSMCQWLEDQDAPNLSVTVLSANDLKTVKSYTVSYSLSDMYISGNKAYRINSDEAVADIITLPFEEPVNLDGLVKTENGWNYYKNGKIDKSFVGLAKNDYGWWYVKNGTIDYSFVGLAKNQYGWWYINNGGIDYKYAGLAKNDYGWWYVKNGTIDYSFKGLAKNQYGWWYVSNGRIDYNYKGLAKNAYGWWYVSNGKIDYSFEGLAKNQYGWWYVSNGKIDYSYKGLAKNDYGWWYVKNGKIDFNYNGTARNPYGRWNVVNGKVTTKAY